MSCTSNCSVTWLFIFVSGDSRWSPKTAPDALKRQRLSFSSLLIHCVQYFLMWKLNLDCTFLPQERNRMKQLLAAQEVVHPRLFFSLRSALSPLMAISHTGENINSLLKLKLKKELPPHPSSSNEERSDEQWLMMPSFSAGFVTS